MKTLLFIVPLFVFVGCGAPSPQREAASHASPFIIALRAYHDKFGDYPQQLDGLRPEYLAANFPIYDNRDLRHSWCLSYQRVDQNEYMIYLDSTPCSQAVFKDGTLISGSGPNFK